MCRTQSIPTEAFSTVLSLAQAGYGSRRIARSLEKAGIWTSKSSVDRLIRGLPPYQDRVVHES